MSKISELELTIKALHNAAATINESANGKFILVAYWFNHNLIRISERLKNLHIPFSPFGSCGQNLQIE